MGEFIHSFASINPVILIIWIRLSWVEFDGSYLFNSVAGLQVFIAGILKQKIIEEFKSYLDLPTTKVIL